MNRIRLFSSGLLLIFSVYCLIKKSRFTVFSPELGLHSRNSIFRRFSD